MPKTPRPARTRVIEAMVDLLQERPLEDITVKLLLSTSQVSRTAFYYNFRGIDDVVAAIVEEFITPFQADIATVRDGSYREHARGVLYMVTLDILNYFYDHKKEYLAILKCGKADEFRRRYVDLSMRTVAPCEVTFVYSDGRRIVLDKELQEYHYRMSVGSCLDCIEIWAQHGFDRNPQELFKLMVFLSDIRFGQGTIQYRELESSY